MRHWQEHVPPQPNPSNPHRVTSWLANEPSLPPCAHILTLLPGCLLQHGAASMPPSLVVVTDKGKGSREQGNLVVKEAIQAVMQHWEAPFR